MSFCGASRPAVPPGKVLPCVGLHSPVFEPRRENPPGASKPMARMWAAPERPLPRHQPAPVSLSHPHKVLSTSSTDLTLGLGHFSNSCWGRMNAGNKWPLPVDTGSCGFHSPKCGHDVAPWSPGIRDAAATGTPTGPCHPGVPRPSGGWRHCQTRCQWDWELLEPIWTPLCWITQGKP